MLAKNYSSVPISYEYYKSSDDIIFIRIMLNAIKETEAICFTTHNNY